MRLRMIAMALGIVLVCFFPSLPSVALLPMAIALLLISPYYRSALVELLILIMLGMSWGVIQGHQLLSSQLPSALEGVELRAQGRIISLPQLTTVRGRPVQRFELALEGPVCPYQRSDLNCYDKLRRLRLSWYDQTELQPGQRWQLHFRAKRPHGMSNPGGFDYQGWLLQRGIGGVGTIREHEANLQLADQVLSIDRWRWRFSGYMDKALPELTSLPILKALLIGDKRSISRQDWALFARTGTIHLMVISGLHIGLIAMLAYVVGRRISLCLFPALAAERSAAVLAMIAAVAYSAAAGFTLPTQRALIMLMVWMLSIYSHRHIAPSQGLVVALWLCLIIDPLAPIGLSFYLSFAAVGLLFYGSVGRKPSRSGLRKSGLSQYLVFIGFIPVLGILLGRVSLLSPVANMIAIPLFSLLIVPVNFCAALLSVFNEDLAIWLWRQLDSLLQWIVAYLTQWDQWFNGGVLNLPGLSFTASVLALIAVMLLLSPRGMPGKSLAWLLLLPLLIVKPLAPLAGDVRVTVLDVGQGLSIVVQTKQHSLVYDVGPAFGESFDAASAAVIPYLQYQGINHVDKLVLSHGDNDHAGGWQRLVEQLPVAAVDYGEWLAGFAPAYRHCHRGQRWHWDGIDFEYLHPGEQSKQRKANNRSCVLRISVAGLSFLLTGDIEQSVELELLTSQTDKLAATVLIAPHHGSNSSSSWPFIKVVRPDHVVFASGYRNQFNHPRANIVKRYTAINSEKHYSPEHGAILFEVVNGKLLTPTHYKPSKRRYWQ